MTKQNTLQKWCINNKYSIQKEKDVAILKADSHPPIFAKNDYKKILRRLNKLEKKER